MSGLRNQLLVGDVRDQLPRIPTASVDSVITSPPYFRLRDYGMTGQIGLETDVNGWVAGLRGVLGELARVIKPSGSLWLNLGDSFSRQSRDGAQAKSLLLGPERLAIAMVADGWTIRNKVVWAKTNPMPTSVRDRLACTYEVLYLAVRATTYYFDLDAIRRPHTSTLKRPSAASARRAQTTRRPDWAGPLAGSNNGLDRLKARGLVGHPLGKNPGDVWRFPTSNYRGVHHAMFPIDLITEALRASCPPRVCSRCHRPWVRDRARQLGHLAVVGDLLPNCSCSADWQPGLVLDPFMGTGTVALAAEAHGRDWLGVELNPQFAAVAESRLAEARAQRSPAAA